MIYTSIMPNGINKFESRKIRCFKNIGSKMVPRSLGHKDQLYGDVSAMGLVD